MPASYNSQIQLPDLNHTPNVGLGLDGGFNSMGHDTYANRSRSGNQRMMQPQAPLYDVESPRTRKRRERLARQEKERIEMASF